MADREGSGVTLDELRRRIDELDEKLVELLNERARQYEARRMGARIAQVMRESNSAQSACQALVELALASGGPDTITVVLAHFISLDVCE